jgi:hypothetical protein
MRHSMLPLLTLVFALVAVHCWGAEPKADYASAIAAVERLTFREPFTLRLRFDKDRYYEQKIENRIPYVARNNVYLFSGESFGLKLTIQSGEISTVTYLKEEARADIGVKFAQEVQDDGKAMMMLTLKNNIKQVLYMDALMIVPEKKGASKTSILPLRPGLGSYEVWPHPIVQLVLRNLRFKNEAPINAPTKVRKPMAETPAQPDRAK